MTHGYRAPEYAFTGKAGKGSDVYSFGVVAIVIAFGRKAVDPRPVVAKPTDNDGGDAEEDPGVVLVEWVWEL